MFTEFTNSLLLYLFTCYFTISIVNLSLDMRNFCSLPMCQTGYYSYHSGILVFKMPHTPDIQDKWMRFLHRESKIVKFIFRLFYFQHPR